MKKDTQELDITQSMNPAKGVLEEVLRRGAQQMLQQAIENEVEEYIAGQQHQRDEEGHRLVVRNGVLPEREILTGIGGITIRHFPAVWAMGRS